MNALKFLLNDTIILGTNILIFILKFELYAFVTSYGVVLHVADGSINCTARGVDFRKMFDI